MRKQMYSQQLIQALGKYCKNCGVAEKLEVDHIVPLSKGGANDFSNLQSLCKKCHLEKSKTEHCPRIRRAPIITSIPEFEKGYITLGDDFSEILDKEVKPFSKTGAHVLLPNRLIGQKVKVLIE